MPKSAVPLFKGRPDPVHVKRPTWGEILDASRPRNLNWLPTALLGVSLALLVAGQLLETVHLPGATALYWAAGVTFVGVMLFYAGMHLLVKLKWIEKAAVGKFDTPKLSSSLPPPPREPTGETHLDETYVASAGSTVDGATGVGTAVQRNVAKAVALRTGAKIAFAPPRAPGSSAPGEKDHPSD